MSFHDSMLDDGYSDEEEYLEHLFDVFDKHQDEIKRLDYSEDYNQEENDDEEEEDYFFNENKWLDFSKNNKALTKDFLLLKYISISFHCL